MRILYLANAPRVRLTGAAVRTLTFARMALDRGAEVTIAGPAGSALQQGAAERGIPFAPAVFSAWPWDVAGLHRVVRETAPDVIHAVSVVPLVLARLSALTGRRPTTGPALFVSIVVDPLSDRVFADGRRRPWSTRLRNTLLRSIAPGLDGVFPVSEAAKSSLEALGVRGHIEIVGALVDVPDLERRALLPADLPAGRPRIVSAPGQLEPLKGVDDLIRAFARVAESRPEAACLVAGEGEQRDELERLAEDLGVGERLHLLGYLDEPAPVIASADVFVSPSHTEGLPGAVAQALALGRPVVATEVGGNGEIVDDGRTGLLVPAGDPDALAAGMGRLLDDPDLAARLGSAGKADVTEHHDVRRAFGTVWDAYRRALAERGVSR